MSVEHARSGDVVEVVPSGPDGRLGGPVALVRDDRLEVMRWVLAAGRGVPEHLGYGPTTIQCVRGVVALVLHDGEARELRPGQVAYLAAGERHAVHARTDAVLLVTMVLVPPPAGMAPIDGEVRRAGPHGARTGAGGAPA